MDGWRKSSYSANNGACVEAGTGPGVVGVRDSALPGSPVLEFSSEEWRRFLAAVKAG